MDPGNLTTTDFVEGKTWNSCGDFRSRTTRVTGGLLLKSAARTPFTSPWLMLRARNCGPGNDPGKSSTRRSGPAMSCVAGTTRWLVSISISMAPPDLSRATLRICAGPEGAGAGGGAGAASTASMAGLMTVAVFSIGRAVSVDVRSIVMVGRLAAATSAGFEATGGGAGAEVACAVGLGAAATGAGAGATAAALGAGVTGAGGVTTSWAGAVTTSCAGAGFVSADATSVGLIRGGALPNSRTVTDVAVGTSRKSCAAFKSITTRVIGGFAVRSEVRTPFTSP